MGLTWKCMGLPRNYIEFHRSPWNSREFREVPWNSMGLFYTGDVPRLDSMLRELRKLLCYDKHWCFSWKMCSDCRKNHDYAQKNEKALALLKIVIKSFLIFVLFAKTRVTMRFRAKNAGYSTGLSQVYDTSYWWPCDADGRTYGRTYGRKVTWLLRHYQNFVAW